MSSSAENTVTPEDDVVQKVRRSQTISLSACMPIHNLRRACSAPRNATKPPVLEKPCQASPTPGLDDPCGLIQTASDELLDVTGVSIRNPYDDEILPTRTNGNQGRLFNWKRVTSYNRVFPERRKCIVQGKDNPRCDCDGESNLALLSEVHSNGSSSPSCFHDPLLEELDHDLPAPPPPPRAMPPWLKLALSKKTDQMPKKYSITPPTTPLSSIEKTDRQKSASLEYDRYGVRIYPVLQNGIKISDTHYWLLEPPRSFLMRGTPSLSRYQSERVPPPSPASQDINSSYINVPPGVNLRRGLSDSNRNVLNILYREMALRLSQAVPTATEAECQAVLIGCGYKYEEALRRLKVELLCRRGYVSRSRCKRLLIKFDWNLEVATTHARREHQIRYSKYLLQTESAAVPAEKIRASPNTLTIETPTTAFVPCVSISEPRTSVSPNLSPVSSSLFFSPSAEMR
ncbi:hypothetical protein T265_08869 [Opisthorchis viverrini]|uniref:UBA domain-containing protein n=1 Tax=Opisthorchis viverrini TaxID=6198 RepID=A0A074Z7R2_OPIVI|nr:hypothetical protein T265_08869 [Opisthorchis viverrini]KER23221.1 hypothetical protein T265_08869 [Opisthorchis viverrini]